jgi:Ni/Fe-hydrogenase 1 B-type cytochrome subunit
MALTEYKIWDAQTRLFHWLNVVCVVGLVAIGTIILKADALGVTNAGKIILKTTHVWVGYVFALNLFWRLIWAFIGGRYARWRSLLPFGSGFLADLTNELRAIRNGRAVRYLGHTPLGRIAVTALLLVLLIQATTGLILAGTDIYMPPFGDRIAEWVAAAGLDPSQVRPYAPETVNPEAYAEMRKMRSPAVTVHEYMYFVLLGLIALHILAVVITEVKHGGSIISAMFTGRKILDAPPADEG